MARPEMINPYHLKSGVACRGDRSVGIKNVVVLRAGGVVIEAPTTMSPLIKAEAVDPREDCVDLRFVPQDVGE